MGKIVVTADCLVSGIVCTFRYIFPNHEIKYFLAPQSEAEKLALSNELADATVWFKMKNITFAPDLDVKTIEMPIFFFDAFHPDLTYARSASTGVITTWHYNSHIVVWAYANRLEPADAAKLFCGEAYRGLGYYDRWDGAVKRMREHWLAAGYSEREFLRFYLSVKREPVFMYSVNHPARAAVVKYAQTMALKFDPDLDLRNRDIVIPDTLLQTIWPVYPEIGLELGLRGSYRWRMNESTELEGVRAMVDFYYARYAEQGIAPEDLVPFSRLPHIDAVLREQLAGA
jgi:hypothetical protein